MSEQSDPEALIRVVPHTGEPMGATGDPEVVEVSSPQLGPGDLNPPDVGIARKDEFVALTEHRPSGAEAVIGVVASSELSEEVLDRVMSEEMPSELDPEASHLVDLPAIRGVMPRERLIEAMLPSRRIQVSVYGREGFDVGPYSQMTDSLRARGQQLELHVYPDKFW